MMKRLFAGTVLMAAAFGAFAQDSSEDPNPLQLSISHGGPGEYQPGQAVEIMISIAASDDGSVTALGLVDMAPDNWTFGGVRGITGDLPAVSPQPGSAGRIEFAWINMPQFPYSFAYTLQVPPDAAGDALIQGQVEYRTTAGRQVTAPDFITIKGPLNLAPRIELIGSPTATVQEGNPYQDPGVTATDPEDGDLTNKVQVSGGVDTSVPGVYEISYDVKDKNGKAAPTVTRTVTVTPKPENETNNGNGNNNGGVNTPVVGNNRGNRVVTGGPGMDGGRVRDARLSNTGSNGNNSNLQPENLPLTVPGQSVAQRNAEQAKRANELAHNLAQNAPMPGGAVTPGTFPPAPGPRTANAAKLASAGADAATPGSPEAEDLAALDDALGIAPNTGETSANATTTNDSDDDNNTKVAAMTGGPDTMKPMAPKVPGMMERVSLRINGLGRRELATIAASAIVLLGLMGFAAVAGRIAYAGPTRRKGNGKVVTAE